MKVEKKRKNAPRHFQMRTGRLWRVKDNDGKVYRVDDAQIVQMAKDVGDRDYKMPVPASNYLAGIGYEVMRCL